MDPCRHPQRKRHAQLRHQPRSSPLWVGDPEDWAVVRQSPRPPLACLEPGCEVELLSCENLHNRRNPRFFRFKSVDRSCGHWPDHDRGGGPVSPQHEWTQTRLTRIARQLGYTATPEHPSTHADVYVHEPGYCLEVQLRSTDFERRTRSRQAAGKTVCWWIPENSDAKNLTKALFSLPAAQLPHRPRNLGRLTAPADRTKLLQCLQTCHRSMSS
ncbi:hypothetical protein GCM10027360_25940 [Amycolatopsis echigonensis]